MHDNNPVAILFGEPVLDIPQGLFIPPDALHIILTEFEGPLDLLLFLIKKQNLDILNIPITLITQQYMQYIDGLERINFELAAEYLLMASVLLNIKSRMLLPQLHVEDIDGLEEDPRQDLVERLVEYEKMKLASEKLQVLPQAGRDFLWMMFAVDKEVVERFPDVTLDALKFAWLSILNRHKNFKHHQIEIAKVTVQEQSNFIMQFLQQTKEIEFCQLLLELPSMQAVVVTFMALLELIKNGNLLVRQEQPLGSIFLQKL